MILISLVPGVLHVPRAREVCARDRCTSKHTRYTRYSRYTVTKHRIFREQSSIRVGFCTGSKDTSRYTRYKRFLDGKDLVKAPNGCSSHPHARGIWSRWSE